MSDRELLLRDALIMYRVRGMIQAKKSTSNASLYRQIFGTGTGTAIRRCMALGFDPYDNNSDFRIAERFLEG